MSYPKTIDEYDDLELERELRLRMRARARGLCDYCGQLKTTPPCKFLHRHCFSGEDGDS